MRVRKLSQKGWSHNMSGADKVPFFTVEVSNVMLPRQSEDFFHNYKWSSGEWAAIHRFMFEALTMHPRAELIVSIDMKYPREVDDLTTCPQHEPSDRMKLERDR
jgi:hypothetical protein